MITKKIAILSLVLCLIVRPISAQEVQKSVSPEDVEQDKGHHHHHDKDKDKDKDHHHLHSNHHHHDKDKDKDACCKHMGAELNHIDAIGDCTGDATVCIAGVLAEYFRLLNINGTSVNNPLFGKLTALTAAALACANTANTCIVEADAAFETIEECVIQRECDTSFDQCVIACEASPHPEACLRACERIRNDCIRFCCQDFCAAQCVGAVDPIQCQRDCRLANDC